MFLEGSRNTKAPALAACVLILLSTALAQAGSLQVKLPAGEYRIVAGRDGREHIEMDGFGHLANPGSAHLPSRIFLIAIPPGVKVDTVRFVPGQPTTLKAGHFIAPSPMVAPLSADDEQVARLTQEYEGKVALADASDVAFPGSVAEYIGTGAYRKYSLVQVRFTPFAYRAASRILSFYPSVEVTVEYSESATMAAEADLMKADANAEAESLAREMIVNYDAIQSSYPPNPAALPLANGEVVTSTGTGFVIVTTSALQSAVAPLANWERCKGRSVYVRTVESIETSYPGDDRAEKIRNFLRDKLVPWSLMYVMLIGDHDTVPMCPAYKEGPCGWGDPDVCWEILDYTPTDYYYAELSLPDNQSWDSHDLETTPTRGEAAYDLVQFPNEVNVGRLPLNDPVEVEAVCRKMADYEYSSDEAYKFKYLFASSFYWPDTDGAAVSEYVINNHILPSQFLPVRIYEHDQCYQSAYASQYDLAPSVVRQVWSNQHNDGHFGFVNLIGHGNPSCVGYRGEHPSPGQCPSGNMFCRWDNSVLDDSYPAMVYGNGCSTAEIEETDNLPRSLLRRGAVGFIGPTRNALGTRGWVGPSSGSSQSLNYWFCRYAVAHQGIRSTFGAAFQSALRHMYYDHGWSNDWGQFFEWNFFGNPDMSINPRPGNLPNLATLTPSGWTYSLVPRSTGDATSSSCVLSGTLPGGTDDTYLNFAYRNVGSITTPTHRSVVYLDGREILFKAIALGGGASSIRLNETSSTVIPGGRHTLSLQLDTGAAVWETSEDDNCWARQFVWSPPLLGDAQPQEMPAPPMEDARSCAAGTTYPNCDGFAFDVWPNYPAAGNQWSVVAVSRPVASYSNLHLWGPGSYTGSSSGFGAGRVFAPVVSSGACELIVINGAEATRGTYYIGVASPTESTVGYRIEKASSAPIAVGINGPFTLASTANARVYEIDLQPGTWRVLLDQSSSTADLGISVYSKDASIAGRTGTGVLAAANTGGTGMDESVDVTVTAAGKYAVAVWKTGPGDYSGSGSYRITVGLGGDPGTPSTPSPADGATGRSVASDLDWADCANAAFYRVYMRQAGAPSFDMIGSPTASTFDPGVLEYGTTYEWYVLAYNAWDEFVIGPTWTFTTMTEPDLLVVQPNGGESWAVGEVRNIQWTSNNCRGLIDIQLSRSAGLPGTWETIASNIGISGTFPWTVTGPVSTQCRIKILGGVCTDTSDADFTIGYPEITVIAPAGGESWYVGETKTITWNSVGGISSVRIELSRDDGSTWSDIVAKTPNDGSHAWTVTSPTSIRCLIRISDFANASVRDLSSNFAIRQRSLTVTSPNGGENWTVRSSRNVTWTSSGLTGQLRIELSRDGGSTWHTLAEPVGLTSPWTWPFVTPPPSSGCRIRVTSLSFPSVTDSSNADFAISCDVAADTDGDCDVDWEDWLAFEACATGSSLSYLGGLPEQCRLAPGTGGLLRIDFDADGDIDQGDFGVFQRCYSGADPADPVCAD